ncbi:MAG TPA: NAD-dependent epimerase/dehydratase family protein [Chloroflexota bacterium]|nr:NAD-dependent epimerase/dehydratase family protein [Chloroflexota bacterium]
MRVLLTDGSGLLGGRLAEALGRQHDVALLEGDPRDRGTAAQATAGADAVVCAPPAVDPGGDPLPALDQASRGTYNLITTASAASRFVLLSSLRPFERYPLDHRVTEYWAPRPTTDPADLVPFLAEAVVREAAHALPLKALCLRLGPVVDDSAPSDARAVHVDDVVQAVERALAFDPASAEPATGWWAFHVVGAGRTRFPLGLAGHQGGQNGRRATLGYAPARDVTGGAPPTPAPVGQPRRFTGRAGGGARRVVIFGAGGPLAAITAPALARDHVLRLADKRPLADIVAEGKPQSRGAPVPRLLEPPHEARVVDVTDYRQVLDATGGMDAAINMTVVRPDPVEAFRVNTLGAYNVIRAAVECGIRRVVQTGPQQVTNTMPGGYWSDFDLPSNVPSRPGVGLYFISKFLGQEIVRVFAEEHDLEVPTLVFGPFTNPEDCEPDQLGGYPFLVSWADAAEAVRGALRAPSFPRPFEVFHIVADLPHGKYRNDRAKELLHWQPRDSLDVHWRRPV